MTEIAIRTETAKQEAIKRLSEIQPDMHRPMEVIIRGHKPKRSGRQNRLLWMIHTQVAAHISAYTGKHWTPEQVHYRIFCPKFLDGEVVELPDGSKAWVSETSSTQTKMDLSDAMTGYIAWATENQIDIELPEDL